MTPLGIVADVSKRLTEQGIRHVVGGSFASSAWGEMRTTNDADIAVMIDASGVDKLLMAFAPPYYLTLTQVEEALSQTGPYRMTNAIHMDEAFGIDLFLVHPDPYNLAEFGRTRRVELHGVDVPFAAPEDIVLQKLLWFEAGSRVSDRQWNDVVRVLEFQRMDLDYAYLRHWASTPSWTTPCPSEPGRTPSHDASRPRSRSRPRLGLVEAVHDEVAVDRHGVLASSAPRASSASPPSRRRGASPRRRRGRPFGRS